MQQEYIYKKTQRSETDLNLFICLYDILGVSNYSFQFQYKILTFFYKHFKC